MIEYDDSEPFIKPRGIHFLDEKDKDMELPKVAVGVFSKYLLSDIVDKYECREIVYIRNANSNKKVYILKYKDQLLTLFMAGIGGPAISADISELHKNGVKKVIIFGNCGVLDSSIEDCSIIIPNLAYREEGTSYHYVKETGPIEVNPKYKEDFIKLLEERDFEYTIGPTWTTDAFYRETKNKIEKYKNLGVKTVEMEGSALAAVCKYLNMDYFTFYYAGDNLDSVEWDERSLSEVENFDKKKLVALLALDLAIEINKER